MYGIAFTQQEACLEMFKARASWGVDTVRFGCGGGALFRTDLQFVQNRVEVQGDSVQGKK